MSSINIVLAGAAGQGIQTVESLLVNGLKRSGLYVYASREYMSRVRGGINSTAIRVSSKPVRAFEERIDLLIPLNELAIPHLKNRIRSKTIVLGEQKFLDVGSSLDFRLIPAPFSKLADGIGSKIYANIIALGVISFILKSSNSN
jgi:2-oxoglutarate ferredoxin oxidoreductase subunit alpha